jgi:pimeloyl-ACP methyl ester carboxylesterase
VLDQFMAAQNGMPQDLALQMSLWTRGGAALLDRIGPAVVLTYSAGGPFGWLVANARPALVKGVVSFEGAGEPLIDPPAAAGRAGGAAAGARGGAAGRGGAAEAGGGAAESGAAALPNVKGIPMLYVTAPNSGRTQGPAIVAALQRSGARAEHLHLRDRGILGNGHFAMLESNREEVFDVIRAWTDAIR